MVRGICFSGHRTDKLPKDIRKLKSLIKNECEKAIDEGYDTFYQGVCYGFDFLCADVVIKLKKKHKNIQLISVVPYLGQEKSWTNQEKDEYEKIKAKSDKVVILYEEFHKASFHERNRYMVDRSEKIVCYCNDKTGGTRYTLNYALKNGLDCVNLATLFI